MSWRPGQRTARQSLETPYEGVPEHLQSPLWEWVDAFLEDPGLVSDVGVEFRVPLPGTSTYNGHREARSALLSECAQNADFWLDLVEYLVGRYGRYSQRYDGSTPGSTLENILESGNSAYKVRSDYTGLEMRTIPEVQAQVEAAVNLAKGSPGEHLANAWNEAYSRRPDPVKSYSESIKAVEAALAPVVSPSDLRATLGTMRKAVEVKPSKWQFVIADGQNSNGVGTMLALMTLLWEGQTSRHGGINATRNETVEEAQAAVHLAATLVQYGVSGAFARVP